MCTFIFLEAGKKPEEREGVFKWALVIKARATELPHSEVANN